MEIPEATLRKFAKELHTLAESREKEAKDIHEGPSLFSDRDHRVIALNNQAEGLTLASMKLLELLEKERKCKRK